MHCTLAQYSDGRTLPAGHWSLVTRYGGARGGTDSSLHGGRYPLLAQEHPEKTAIVFVSVDGSERQVSWRELDERSNQVARLLAGRGVGEHSLVVVGLPNCPEHYVATFAAWKLGALVLPLRAVLPGRERDQILELGDPAVVVADWEDVTFPLVTMNDLAASMALPAEPLPDRTPHPGKAIASGGSTGRPKIIVDPRPLVHRSPRGWSRAGSTRGCVQTRCNWSPGRSTITHRSAGGMVGCKTGTRSS